MREEYDVFDKVISNGYDAEGPAHEGRRFSDGLPQALEAKEGVPLQSLKGEARRTTFQAFLRQYQRLAGVWAG